MDNAPSGRKAKRICGQKPHPLSMASAIPQGLAPAGFVNKDQRLTFATLSLKNGVGVKTAMNLKTGNVESLSPIFSYFYCNLLHIYAKTPVLVGTGVL